MQKLRVITYDGYGSTPRVMEISHKDTSAFGLNVIAVVDNTGCGRDDPHCPVCEALYRRIKSRIGASQTSGYTLTKKEG